MMKMSCAHGAHPRMRGENVQMPFVFRPRTAHPRMRGENWRKLIREAHSLGSSPHARGKPARRDSWFSGRGLIPACAGKTRRCMNPNARAEAHPRMRGENGEMTGFRDHGDGSSPHARGKQTAARVSAVESGLIPACAGKTLLELVQWRAIEPTRYNLSCGNYPHEAPLARGRMRTIIK